MIASVYCALLAASDHLSVAARLQGESAGAVGVLCIARQVYMHAITAVACWPVLVCHMLVLHALHVICLVYHMSSVYCCPHPLVDQRPTSEMQQLAANCLQHRADSAVVLQLMMSIVWLVQRVRQHVQNSSLDVLGAAARGKLADRVLAVCASCCVCPLCNSHCDGIKCRP